MKKKLLFLLLFTMTQICFSEKIGVLAGVNRPSSMEITGDRLCIIEGATIHVYSIRDLREIRSFGKQGEGPGELKIHPTWGNRLNIFPDSIYVESIDKVIEFSWTGQVIQERRKPVETTQFTPVANHFVAKKVKRDPVKNIVFMTVTLYDHKMNEVRELVRQKFPQQRIPGGVKIELYSDLLNFQIAQDRIFIEESPEGFLIEVFDSQGKLLYRIRKPYMKKKVTASLKEKALEKIKHDPFIQRRLKQQGSWEKLNRVIHFSFPDFLPPIRSMIIADRRIFIQTFNQIGGEDEVLVMDLKGKNLKKIYVPSLPDPGMTARVAGMKWHSIKQNQLYYLVENLDSETWELHRKILKQ